MNPPDGLGWYVRRITQRTLPLARAMRCTWLALLPGEHAGELADAAQAAGLDVYVWDWPSQWTPGTFRVTARRARSAQLRLGARGIIADIETARAWLRASDREVDELVQAVRELDAGVTTFPAHPLRHVLAPVAAWGSPQLYARGMSAPRAAAWSRGVLASWAREWRELVPSYAAWNRSPAEQRRYLDALPAVRSAILWGPPNGPTPAISEVIARWDPRIRPASRRRERVARSSRSPAQPSLPLH